MKSYDQMASGEPAYYSMLTGPKNFHASNINTDKNGFRNSYFKGQVVNTETVEQFESVNVVLGGSTVFGVGADDDRTTLASYLSEITGEPWLNLGVRGCNSFQEIIYLTQNIGDIKKIKNLVFFSGANDSFIDILRSEDTGYDRQVNELPLKLYQVSKKRVLAAMVLGMIKGVSAVKLVNLSLKQMIFFKEDESGDDEFKFNFNRLEKINNRNFKIYSIFEKSCSGKVNFFLQPLFTWTGKKASAQEEEALKILDFIQKGTNWDMIKPIYTTAETHQKIAAIFASAAKKNSVDFLDLNPLFNSPESYFVDNVHLTSQGYQLAAKIVSESLVKKRSR